MKVRVYGDELYPVYFLNDSSYGIEIEFPIEEYDDLIRTNKKWEYFQDMISEIVEKTKNTNRTKL